MSLNRYEQAIFEYWKSEPDERRHWQTRVGSPASFAADPGALAKILERELWDYLVERSQHVTALRAHFPGGVTRVSLLNLAELMLRSWGSVTKPKKSPGNPGRSRAPEFS